jgi:hypothetical protein
VDLWAPADLDISAAIAYFQTQGYTVSKFTNIRVDISTTLNAINLEGKTDAYIADVLAAREKIKGSENPFPKRDHSDEDNDHESSYMHFPRFRKHIRKVVTLISMAGRPSIQIMVVNSPTVFDAVLLFDLDVCRIIYDGKCVLSAQGDDVCEVSITKECLDVICTSEWQRTIKRMGKYIDRGYTPNWTSVIEHFKAHFNTRAAEYWNRAVLRQVCGVYALKHYQLPYWTRSDSLLGADLVVGDTIMCHIPDTRPMCKCGKAKVLSMRKCVLCIDPAVFGIVRKFETWLPTKFEITINEVKPAAVDSSYNAEWTAFEDTVKKYNLDRKHRAINMFIELGLIDSSHAQVTMVQLLEKHNGDAKLAYKEFIGESTYECVCDCDGCCDRNE